MNLNAVICDTAICVWFIYLCSLHFSELATNTHSFARTSLIDVLDYQKM